MNREYKFKKEVTNPPKGSKLKPHIEYGVERDSLDEEISSLYYIAWNGWTTDEIQMIIDQTNALTGGEIYEYQVEGSDLIISIDIDYAYFFDWRTKKETEDFSWKKSEFLKFMKDFKVFVEKN